MPDDVASVVEALVELIRQEAPPLLVSGCTWKLQLNGDGFGSVRMVTEVHANVIQRFKPITLSKPA